MPRRRWWPARGPSDGLLTGPEVRGLRAGFGSGEDHPVRQVNDYRPADHSGRIMGEGRRNNALRGILSINFTPGERSGRDNAPTPAPWRTATLSGIAGMEHGVGTAGVLDADPMKGARGDTRFPRRDRTFSPAGACRVADLVGTEWRFDASFMRTDRKRMIRDHGEPR